MKISDLRKYRENVEKIEALERQLSHYWVTDTVKGSGKAPAYAIHGHKIEGYANAEKTHELKRQIKELTAENDRIFKFIESVQNKVIYEALLLYCVADNLGDKPTWEQVAEYMEIEPDTLRMRCTRYLVQNAQNSS